MKRGYYDYWIGHPKYKTAFPHGMSWTESNKRYAIALVRQLLKNKSGLRRIGIIRFRERGKMGDVLTWHKQPLVWRSDSK